MWCYQVVSSSYSAHAGSCTPTWLRKCQYPHQWTLHNKPEIRVRQPVLQQSTYNNTTSWLQHVHIGRLQAFACINFASATLPRSWVNKGASIEVLLGLSFYIRSKSTTKICQQPSKCKYTTTACYELQVCWKNKFTT